MLLNKLFVFLIVVGLVAGTLSPSSRGEKKKRKNAAKKPSGLPAVEESKAIAGPIDETVFDRNLVQEEPLSRDILYEHGAYSKETSQRHFSGTVLGYVTPWNNHGYEVAKTFGRKFDIISPVWLQVIRKGELDYGLSGTHDVDGAWLKNVRSANPKTKILPRVMFDKFESNDYTSLLSQKDERDAMVQTLYEACKKYSFDGIVLEVWQSLAKRIDDVFLYNLVKDIAGALKKADLDVILVIPPAREQMHDLFTADNFNELYSSVAAFSLMTYDFSTLERPGANAPLFWVRNAVEHICPKQNHRRKKILLGLNMYGYDYTPQGGGSIVGRDYLRFVEQYVPARLLFDDHDRENFFEVKTDTDGRHIIFYPSLFSINERIQLAAELGTGLSVWEIGQGLDYFYDLF